MKKIGISIPSTGMWLERTAMCLQALTDKTEHSYSILSKRGSLLPKSRRILVETALQDDCSHILFIDSDMTFPPDTIERLLKREMPVVAANCTTKRKNKFDQVIPTAQNENFQPVYTDDHSVGTEKVYRVGTAVMLIEREVFEKIQKPWFAVGYNPSTSIELGEDYFFCEQLFKADIPLYIDHDLSKHVGHVGLYETTYRDIVRSE